MAGHSGIFEDDGQWQRDELLIQADEAVAEILFGIEQRQAERIRRMLDHIWRLKSQLELTPMENHKVDKAISALRLHLTQVRSK